MNALIHWQAPTHYTNGQPIAVPLTYDLYWFRAHSITQPIKPYMTGIRGTFVMVHDLPPDQEACFTVRAVTPDGAHSHISNIACKHT